MSAYANLPALLERIDAVVSDATLCRRRDCYRTAFTWLSPYCRPWCTPQLHVQASTSGLSLGFHDAGSYAVGRYAMQVAWRYSAGLARPDPRNLLIITAC